MVAGLAASSAALPRHVVRCPSPVGGRARQRARRGAPGARPHGIPRPWPVSPPRPAARRGRRRGGSGPPPCAAACSSAARAGARSLDRAMGADGRIAALPLSIPVGLLTAAIIERARASVPEPTTTGPDAPQRSRPTTCRRCPGSLRGQRCSPCSGVLDGRSDGPRSRCADSRPARRPAPASSGDSPPTPPSRPSRVSGSTPCGAGRCRRSRPAAPTSTRGCGRRRASGRTRWSVATRPASCRGTPSAARGDGTPSPSCAPRWWSTRPPCPDGSVPDDLSIPTVMGEPARAHPVQVFVGLDSAPTPDRAGRARHRGDGPHRRVVALDAHARLADGHRLRQLRRRRRRAVPHAR